MDAVLSSRSCLSILSIFQSLLLEFQQFPSTKDVFLRMKTKHAVPFIPFLMKLFDQTHRLKTSEPKCVPSLVEKFKVISKNITFSTVITLQVVSKEPFVSSRYIFQALKPQRALLIAKISASQRPVGRHLCMLFV